LNVETLDGKNSLHITVGIAYQNQYVPDEHHAKIVAGPSRETSTVSGRARRTFEGIVKECPVFRLNLRAVKFSLSAATTSNDSDKFIEANALDILWVIKSVHETVPQFNGFYSLFVEDRLPMTVIACMDPINESPTLGKVVQATMERSLKVAEENGQMWHPVTYDLNIAMKAFASQALRAPKFDKLIILLGNFHVVLAFFGAVGTDISDSGLEYLLTEGYVLAEGSLNGFVKGKFYNQCTRIHQITAGVLEQLLYERFLSDRRDQYEEVISRDNVDIFGRYEQTGPTGYTGRFPAAHQGL